MTSDVDSESTTIQNALVFYQRYLINEIQRRENNFRKNGKLPFSEEDARRQDAYHRQLQNVAAVLDSRQQGRENRPRQSLDSTASSHLSYRATNVNEADHKPYISPLTGQWVIPDTRYTPTPSASSLTPPSIKTGGQVPSQALQTQSEPTNSQEVLAKQRSVPSLPEVFTPSNPGAYPSQLAYPQLSNYSESAAARGGTQPSNVPLQSYGDPGTNWTTASFSEVEAKPEAFTSRRPFPERQGQRPTGTFSDANRPWTPVSKPAVENVNPASPAVEHTRRQPSWQSATWSDIMSEPQKPATPSSLHPGQRQESPGNLVPPLSVHKRGSPISSVLSHERRHVSTPSSSTDELASRPSSTSASYPGQSLPPPPPPSNPANNAHTLRLRPQPVFNVFDSGKSVSSVGNGIRSVSLGQAEPQASSRSPSHGQFLSQNEGSSSLPLHSKQRTPLNTTGLGGLPGESGGGKTFPPLPSTNQTKQRPELQPPRLSSDSNSFTLPIFSNDAQATTNSVKFPDTNGEVGNQLGFQPSNQNTAGDILGINKPRGKYNQGEFDTSRMHGNDPFELSSKITQQHGGLNNGSSNIQNTLPDPFSTRSASDSRVTNQHHVVSSHTRNVSLQSPFTPPQNGLPASPFQSKSSFNQKADLSSPSAQQPFNTASPRLQNGIAPNQQGSLGPGLRDGFQSQQDVPNRIEPGRPALTVSEDPNGISPNQLKPMGLRPRQTINTGQTSLERAPQDHFARKPSDGPGSPTARQVKPNSMRETAVADHRLRQSRLDPPPGRQESLASTNFNSNLDEQLRLAQTVADSADQDELAMLKRMQDEWNREEHRREANDYAMAQNLQNTFSSNGVASDPIHFAASPTSEQPPTNIIVNPVRSTPAQNKRTAAHSDANDNIRQLDHQAQMRIPSTSSPSVISKLKPHANNSAAKNPECTVCGDTLTSPSETTTLPCNHTYHPACLASGFQHALAGGKIFTCCPSIPVPIDTVSSLLPPEFVANYKVKVIERSTPNPTYCAKPGCASFISQDHITGPLATCAKCGFVTCKMCRNPEHKGVCPPDTDGRMLMRLAGNKNWCQCQRCKSMVERTEGCLHMTCDCGYEFCYNCGGVWATCGARCNRKS